MQRHTASHARRAACARTRTASWRTTGEAAAGVTATTDRSAGGLTGVMIGAGMIGVATTASVRMIADVTATEGARRTGRAEVAVPGTA